MNKFASANLTAGQLNAIVKKLGGEQGALRLLRGELVISDQSGLWKMKDNLIYFSVTSDGTTGEQWVHRLKHVTNLAKKLLLSDKFKPTKGVTYNLVCLNGEFFSNDDRTIDKISREAEKRNWGKPNPEVVCLLSEKFSKKDLECMGLLLLEVMHEPIKASDGRAFLLGGNEGPSGKFIGTCLPDKFAEWCGFVYSI